MSGTETHKNSYSRREWLQLSSMAVAALSVPNVVMAHVKRPSYQYHLAQVQTGPFTLPAAKKMPFDWPVGELSPGDNSVVLKWKELVSLRHKKITFRITSATDVREECSLQLMLAGTGEKICVLHVHYAHYMQPFEFAVDASIAPKILKEGISISMVKGTNPFWFFVPHQTAEEIPDAFLPHLLVWNGAPPTDAWKARLLSFASLSTFGWMEGCVLDGLAMMAHRNKKAETVLQQHLAKYVANNTLVYEAYNNERITEKINNVESILPFAILAGQNPNHAMLQVAIHYCTAQANANGIIADGSGIGRKLKTEECYTVAYPLAVLAKKLNRPALQTIAIANLQARVDLLATQDVIYQNSTEEGPPVYGNWARGAGWYLLGMAKTLAHLPGNSETKSLRISLLKGAEAVIKHQQKIGLWSCFLHQPETGIETSGSACIAAALAYGYSEGLLSKPCKAAADKCYAGLQNYITPDGFLTGTSQVNKGGEALQRNGFRVISPYTLGFMGILDTSLKSPENRRY